MKQHFLIFGLPRSMTAWVSCFLTCGEVFCQHEISYEGFHVDVLKQPFLVSGVCDSGLAFHYERLSRHYPDAKIVWLSRPDGEVRESLMNAAGLSRQRAEFLISEIHDAAFGLNEWDNCMEISTTELQTEAGARRLWEYVAPNIPLPPAHLKKMLSLRVVQKPEPTIELLKSA